MSLPYSMGIAHIYLKFRECQRSDSWCKANRVCQRNLILLNSGKYSEDCSATRDLNYIVTLNGARAENTELTSCIKTRCNLLACSGSSLQQILIKLAFTLQAFVSSIEKARTQSRPLRHRQRFLDFEQRKWCTYSRCQG